MLSKNDMKKLVYKIVGDNPGFLIILAFFCGTYSGMPMERNFRYYIAVVVIITAMCTIYWMSTFYGKKNNA